MSKWFAPFPDKFITGHYGTLSAYRRKMKMQAHSGTDWARPEGTPIKAIARGRVEFVAFSKILGHVLVQRARHKNGQLHLVDRKSKGSNHRAALPVATHYEMIRVRAQELSSISANHDHLFDSACPQGL